MPADALKYYAGILDMPDVLRSVANYQVPFLHLNAMGEQRVSCKKADLYRCAVTVGNPTYISLRLIRQHHFWPVLSNSIIKKCLLISTNIETHGSLLRRRSIFDTYVSDDKKTVSYNVGMALAKFHSERLLDIRNLLHLEFLRQQNAVVFVQQAGGKRPQEPDLLGQSADGSWHLFEAKGSSYENKLSKKLIEGKIQAQQVFTVHGQLPATRTISATYLGADRIYTRIEDPSDRGASVIDFEDANFNRAYYAPFLISQQPGYPGAKEIVIDGVPVMMFGLDSEVGMLHIGVLSHIYPFLLTSDFGALPGALADSADLSGRGGDQYSFGRDGFVIGFEPY